jgi:pimeloyl-ACP methyl ester carboxylesterase
MEPSRNGHLPINGLSLYHEVYGELGTSKTAPLLLIPGAFMATGSMRSWVSAFAGKRTVIVFDQQGHGRTRILRVRCLTSGSPTMPRPCCARCGSSARM